MKRIKNFVLTTLLLAQAVLPPLGAHLLKASAASTNLIANPSVEVTSNNLPEQWNKNNWGTNTAVFTHLNTGNTGSKSLRTEITSYTDGDAKWYANPVAVVSGKQYVYEEYYRSNISSDAIVQYQRADGSVFYEWIETASASTNWQQKRYDITIPADAVKFSMFHVIAQIGWLETDDFSLTLQEDVPAPESGNLIANPSLEQGGTQPTGWLSNAWGTNTAQFTYNPTGNTGSKSVKTTVTSFTDGDAKWYFAPVSVTPGETYTYSHSYQATLSTEVVVQYTDSLGANSYAYIGSVAQASTWTPYQFDVQVPVGITKMTVFHVVAGVGSLSIDDASLAVKVSTPTPESGNLITNPSLEQGGTQPTGWLSNAWGTNTAQFTYESSGNTGSKSVKTTVTSFTDGDAKWYFAPVSVTPGKTYEYRHMYTSTVATEVVVQYSDAVGANTYVYIGAASAASNWAAYNFTVVVPSGITKMTVFHVVAGVGSLSIDDASLMLQTTTATNPIANASLETSAGNLPARWSSNSWGTNDAQFTYQNEGHTGTRSARVDITSYASGDAKWIFDSVNLVPGEEYRFSVWFKTNANPGVVAMHTLADGSVTFRGMPVSQPGEGSAESAWTLYSDTFSVPVNAVSTTVFMILNSAGWVQTDDYALEVYQEVGFNRPLVTLTFDDGHEDNTATALPIMQSYGFLSTQCYATTFIEDAVDQQTVINNLLQFKTAGHEICSHTVSHPFLTQITPSEVDYELRHAKEYLQSITGEPVLNFATPYGDYNASVNNAIKSYYQSHRTVNAGYNSKDNFDRYQLKVQNMLSTTTLAELQSWLDHAAKTNTWLILVYHRVASNPGTYDTYTADFAEHMRLLSNSGLTVKTYQAGLDEVLPQL